MRIAAPRLGFIGFTPMSSHHVFLSRRSLLTASGLALALPYSHCFAATIPAPSSHPLWLSPLAQRCAKAYSQTALNILPEQGKAVMVDAQRGIASSVAKLRGADRTQLQREVLRFDTLLTAAPQRKILLAVSHQSNVLQSTAMHAQAVDATGELAMLSQRIAKNFFLVASGIEQPAVRSELNHDQRLFTRTLQAAKQEQRNTLAKLRALELAEAQWTFYDVALRAPEQAVSQMHVALTSERLWRILSPLSA